MMVLALEADLFETSVQIEEMWAGQTTGLKSIRSL